MTKKVDKNQDFMRNQWGTEFLSSEYGWDQKIEKQKMLREIKNDSMTPKKSDFALENELYTIDDNQNKDCDTKPLYELKNL